MSGSGVEDVLKTVYALNAVGHMLAWKAVQRDVRGHVLVENALSHKLHWCSLRRS